MWQLLKLPMLQSSDWIKLDRLKVFILNSEMLWDTVIIRLTVRWIKPEKNFIIQICDHVFLATIDMYPYFQWTKKTLRWRHNGRDGVSNHQPHDCLLNRLFGRRSKWTSKLRVTGLCVGNSPGTGEIPAQMASNAENVSTWWRHHELVISFVSLDTAFHHFASRTGYSGTPYTIWWLRCQRQTSGMDQ